MRLVRKERKTRTVLAMEDVCRGKRGLKVGLGETTKAGRQGGNQGRRRFFEASAKDAGEATFTLGLGTAKRGQRQRKLGGRILGPGTEKISHNDWRGVTHYRRENLITVRRGAQGDVKAVTGL